MKTGNLSGGRIQLRLISADIAAACKEINQEGIALYTVHIVDTVTIEFTVSGSVMTQLGKIVARRGDRISICEKSGIYWNIISFLRRWVLVTVIIMLTILTLWIPSRVLFVFVEGNFLVPSEQICLEAANAGVSIGVSRREIDNETVKNTLLAEIPELEWAGINTSGCVATITVRESLISNSKNSEEFAQLYAACDGIVTSCTIEQGTALCTEGDAVTKGQLLISGYSDCGGVILQTKVQGEVFAKTEHNLTAIMDCFAGFRRVKSGEVRRLCLLIGKNRINLWKDSGICPGTCGRMYKEYRLTLPGGFVIPLGIGVDTVISHDLAWREFLGEELLLRSAEQYLQSHMVAGQILEQQEQLARQDGLWVLQGKYLCHEQIGRIQQ